MENLFQTIYSNGISATYVLGAIACALVGGLLMSWIASFRLRASRSLFITAAIIPTVVCVVFSLIEYFLSASSTTTITMRLVTAAVAFGLIRFRSAQGKADEMLLLFLSTATGFAFGMGYLAYGFLICLGLAGIYVLLTFLPLFDHKYIAAEKLLKIVVPESLNYTEIFDDTFAHYLKVNELVEVKTTNMGSMYKLSYRVRLKNGKEEKEFIDELRTKNGNLEVSLLPYVDTKGTL